MISNTIYLSNHLINWHNQKQDALSASKTPPSLLLRWLGYPSLVLRQFICHHVIHCSVWFCICCVRIASIIGHEPRIYWVFPLVYFGQYINLGSYEHSSPSKDSRLSGLNRGQMHVKNYFWDGCRYLDRVPALGRH